MSGRKRDDNDGLGCALILVGIVFAMPLVGVYLMLKGSEDEKAVGGALAVLGIIIWIYLFFNMN